MAARAARACISTRRRRELGSAERFQAVCDRREHGASPGSACRPTLAPCADADAGWSRYVVHVFCSRVRVCLANFTHLHIRPGFPCYGYNTCMFSFFFVFGRECSVHSLAADEFGRRGETAIVCCSPRSPRLIFSASQVWCRHCWPNSVADWLHDQLSGFTSQQQIDTTHRRCGFGDWCWNLAHAPSTRHEFRPAASVRTMLRKVLLRLARAGSCPGEPASADFVGECSGDSFLGARSLQ